MFCIVFSSNFLTGCARTPQATGLITIAAIPPTEIESVVPPTVQRTETAIIPGATQELWQLLILGILYGLALKPVT
jgi:hypothetical protein